MTNDPDNTSGTTMPARTDLAIIGGGPAGATLAALAAARGRDVVLLEKSRHPRFHIGESLLPANLDIFEQLGVLDRIHASGVYKPGADFQDAAPDSVRRAIRFDRALRPRREHAYHVLRSELDQLLFEHAARAGARVLNGARVRDVRFRPGTEAVLTVQTPAGIHALSARLVVDASGRDTVIGRKLKLQRRNRQHATAALYAHFHNVPRNEGDEAGNISIYWFDQGWIWMIPLPRGVMSIGAVCNPDYLRQRDSSPDAFLLATLQRNPHAWARAGRAEMIGRATATGNYAYQCRRMHGPGWLLIGDAYAFVDPIFSSGVFLGMHSAVAALPVVEAELDRRPWRARLARARFRQRVQRGIREFSWFIYRFPSPVMRQLFLNPRNIAGIEQAVISLVSGDVIDNRAVRRRLRLFRLIYLLSCLSRPRAAWAARRQRRRNARVVPG